MFTLILMFGMMPPNDFLYEIHPSYESCLEAGYLRQKLEGKYRLAYDCVKTETLTWMRSEIRKPQN